MLRRSLVVLALAAVAAPHAAVAQGAAKDPVSIALMQQWQGAIMNITAVADEASEADYAYRPIGTVRTLGEMIAHVAGAQASFCAAVLGKPAPAEDAVEKGPKTKAAIVAALKASTATCKDAYAVPAGQLGAEISMFGGKMSKASLLALNAVHDGEHYGNLVTYLRMQGKVPPSSRR